MIQIDTRFVREEKVWVVSTLLMKKIYIKPRKKAEENIYKYI